LPSQLLGIISAITSAAIWGAGDFAGGYASRRISPYQALAATSLVGMLIFVAAALVSGEPLPAPAHAGWAALAGALGALGIVALYQGLAVGSAALVSPTAGVVGAALPVAAGALLEGLPSSVQFAGFTAGIAGIWLASRESHEMSADLRRDLGLGFLAGLGFGGFFVCLGQIETGLVFSPLVISKAAALALSGVILAQRRLPFPSLKQHPVAALAGLLDAGGNLFYFLAVQLVRLDVAAVIASMYPASTVLLAQIFFRQRVSAAQWLGVVLCLVGVALIVY
jgi:drug/metabolite transporter (DMT)-like permease